MKNNKFVALVILGSLMLAMPVLAKADNSQSNKLRTNWDNMKNWGSMMRLNPDVIGTVVSVNGATITVTSNKIGWGRDGKDDDTPATTPTPVTYTVNASGATIYKAGVASTVANIAVGDMIMVQGTITGTNIVATTIHSGMNKGIKTPKPTPTPLIQGNGQPIIAGVISAINGTTLTVTNQSNVTYTVNASTAKVQNKGVISTLSTVAVGDNVVVQGAINGTSVTAYSVIDQGTMPNAQSDDRPAGLGKFFGGIGRFFQGLFGF